MSIYIGVNGKARKVVSGYIGDAYGNAQVIYKAGIVPSGYIPVQYIYNDHDYANYIDTELKPNTYTRIICKISFGPKQTSSITRIIVGNGYNINIIKNYGYNSSNNIRVAVGDSEQTVTYQDSTVHTLDLNRDANKGTYSDNTLLFTNSSSFTDNNNIAIFHSEGLVDMRIWSCAIYQSMLNGTLSKNYIPCIRVSDGRVGMWESVGKIFKTGSNDSHQYSSGPVITS